MTSAPEMPNTANVDPFAAMESLRATLDRAGIVFPSLGVDPQETPRVRLLELGRVRPDVAMRLADALRRGAAA
ncbi:hypothetical protein OHA71_42740 [Streptomyces sp. NBC_00444]|uniref:hypothetical protein n=1 Tax=Streptomyces sp. NBC_00444 TaxID=2975744 RepID=UPI002E1C3B66